MSETLTTESMKSIQDYRRDHPKGKTVIPVIIPCLNEARTIDKVVMMFKDTHPSAEVYVNVVIDPETIDASAHFAMMAGASLLHPKEHGKGQGVQYALDRLDHQGFREYIFCDGDITISPAAVSELLMPLNRHAGQKILVPRFPTATEWDEATATAGLKFNPDAWPLVSGIRRVRRECIPNGLWGYLMETQINKCVAENGFTTERAYSHDTISPLRFTKQRVADLLANGRYGKEHGIL